MTKHGDCASACYWQRQHKPVLFLQLQNKHMMTVLRHVSGSDNISLSYNWKRRNKHMMTVLRQVTVSDIISLSY